MEAQRLSKNTYKKGCSIWFQICLQMSMSIDSQDLKSTNEQVNKETFVYPDVLCILDFPRGDEDYRLYRMSQLCNQFNAFAEELSTKVEAKLKEWYK